MSFNALAAIKGLQSPGPSALLILFILADYAGADGTCKPSQATIAERTGLSIRGVRDNLHKLQEEGFIRMERRTRKDGTRTSDRIVLLYYTPEEKPEFAGGDDRAPAAAAPAAKFAASLGDDENIPGRGNRQITTDLPAADAGLTSFEPVSEAIRERSLSFEGEQEFEEVWQAWRAADPAYVWRAEAVEAWCAWVGPHSWKPWQLRDALLGYLKYRQRGGTSGPEWMHRLIKRGPEGWGHLVPKEPDANAVRADAQQGSARRVFGGPVELRQAIVENGTQGPKDAEAYLDPSSWDEATRTIIATGTARDRLLERHRKVFTAHGVSVVWSREWPSSIGAAA